MKNFFKIIISWCSSHVWQSIVSGVALVGVVTTSIVLPIALNKDEEPEDLTNKADKVLYGTVVTMDETNPVAEAVAIKDGKIFDIGNKTEIANLVGKNTITETYDNGYIYPGFVDAHSHYALMSSVIGGATIISSEKPGEYDLGDYEAYAKEVKKYVDANPTKDIYQAYGMWVTPSNKYGPDAPTAAMLDEWCPTEKPVIIIGAGGHDCWLNTPAIKTFIGNFEGNQEEKDEVANWIREVGSDCVSMDRRNPNVPKGYFVETARFKIADKISHSVDEIKEFIEYFQDVTLEKGYTTIGDCSIIENASCQQVTAFKELEDEGKLKIKFRSYYEIREYDTKETRAQQLQYAIQLAEETKNNDYFQVVGIKVFIDGVYEALSASLFNTYPADSGKDMNYKGIARWHDDLESQLKELVYEANKAGLAMEFHAMGDAAIKQALDACQYANEKLVNDGGEAFKKNAISHLGFISQDDMTRFNSLGVTAVVAPQWTAATKSAYPNEVRCLGENNADKMFPIKSIIDTGANVAFHTDGANVNVPEMIYDAVTRRDATHEADVLHVRGEGEKITGLESLKCLTVNAAYVLNSASTTGMIKIGESADFSIYNKDYRDNDVAKSLETFNTAQLLALYSSGNKIA